MFSPILVHDYLSFSAQKFPDKEALIYGNERLTYKDLDERSDALSCALIDAGMNRHDRVIIFLDSSFETVISLYGILKAGGTFVILNSSMKAKKLRYILEDSGATFLITHTKKADIIHEVFGKLTTLPTVLWIGDSFPEIVMELSTHTLLWDEIYKNLQSQSSFRTLSQVQKSRSSIDVDLAALIYTSGSTGEPKGVMSSHYNMVSAARSIIQYIGNKPDDIIIDVLPLSFDYGLYQVIMAFIFGGTVVLEKSFLYPVKILESIEKERVTGFPIVPTIASLLLKMKNINNYDLSCLRYMTNTGAALPVETIQKLKIILPNVKLFSMFGLTECKRVSYMPPEELNNRPSSVGKAIPNCEVFIIDDNGKEVSLGEVGELVVRGANVTMGYWNAPDLTIKTFRNGRYPGERILYSGDLFKKDKEGYLYFVGRIGEMIKTKGERVSPKEIENVLFELEQIVEAAVIGIPDEIFGEVIKAYVVPYPNTHITTKEILSYCRKNLESFMIPQDIEIRKELPKTSHGKIDKKALVQWECAKKLT